MGETTDLRSHGVNGEFIRESKSLGYNFTARELIDLRTHSVDGGYLRRLRDAGMQNLTASCGLTAWIERRGRAKPQP